MATCTAQYNYNASRNEDFAQGIVFTGLDLTGCAVRMQLREYQGAPDPAYATADSRTISPAGSKISIDEASANSSSITFKFAEADLAAIPGGTPPADPDQIAYDVVVIYADGQTERFQEGMVFLGWGTTEETG